MNTFVNSVYSRLEEIVNKYINGEINDKNKVISSITGASLRGDIKPHEEEHLLDLLNKDLSFDDEDEEDNENENNKNSFISIIEEDDQDDLDDFLEDDEDEEEPTDNSGFLGLLGK